MEPFRLSLDRERKKGIYRALRPLERLGGGYVRLAGGGEPLLDFSSNDYLALSEEPTIISAGREWLERIGAGAGAARLMSGDYALHHELEEETASLKGTEASLVFGSGYMANVGIIPSLVGRGDTIFVDRLSHASIYDGCLLSRARIVRFRHNDLDHLAELLRDAPAKGRCLVVVESIYSMDGDRCPLRELVSLKNSFPFLLMVDEAHATGVFGARGGGIAEQDGVAGEVDIAMGTYGKALGSYGAYAACCKEMAAFLVNRARSFIFSTALPPPVIGASLAAVRMVRRQPEIRRDLAEKMRVFKESLEQGGLANLGPSQIVPVIVGVSTEALALAEELRKRGVFATAVRPPTVPEGTSRLRFSITRHHSVEALRQTAAVLMDLLGNKRIAE